MVVRCLGVFEWSCSACRTTQSVGNETSQISPQPKRRCSCLDSDGHPTMAATSCPAAADPVFPDPILLEPVLPEPILQISVLPEPILQGSVLPDPILPEQVLPEPILQGSVLPDPILPESELAAHVRPELVLPDPVLPESTAEPTSSHQPTPSFHPEPIYLVTSSPEADLDSESDCESFLEFFSPTDEQLPAEPEPVTYSILETGSQYGKRLLIGSDGHDFGIRRYGASTARWDCYVSSCKAYVTQRGDTFNQQHFHKHTPNPNLKVRAVDDIDQSAESIAEEICSKVPKEAVNPAKTSDLVIIVKNTRRPSAPVPNQPVAPEKHPKDPPVTYEILEKGSSQGKPLLVSSDGYDFRLLCCDVFIKKWVCNKCPAAVSQRGDSYQPGQREHTHPPQPYIKLKRQMVAEAKEMALSDINKSADSIAKEICSKVPKEVLNVVPNLRNIIYATRRKDLKTRGKN